VETPFSQAGGGKDLKAASRDGARYAITIGPDEWSARSANLKDLRAGTEERVPIDRLAENIRKS
jgi:histidyl-tRNA synthetase